MIACKNSEKKGNYGLCKAPFNPQVNKEFRNGRGGFWTSCRACREYAKSRKGQKAIIEIVEGSGPKFADMYDKVNYGLWLGRMVAEVKLVSQD